MIIRTSAPTRIDLAGGTIDIPPLFLFHEGAATVNFAISPRAFCTIETRDDDRILIESIDLNDSLELSVDEVDRLKEERHLQLLAKLVYFFRPQRGFHMATDSKAPAGAGLAGSSTLNIACIAALNELVGKRYQPERFIQIAAAVECQVIKVPTGYQDYYSAQYGGLSCIHFGPAGMEREELKADISLIESRFAVCYTGEPRNSGTNNWELTKRHIDGDRELFDLFEGIRDSALEIRSAIIDGNWDAVGKLLAAAHPQRKKLSPNITTPHMDHLIDVAAANGAIAPKVCGAGGGGCIAFFCEEGRRKDVEIALAGEEGCEVLEWGFSESGLEVEIEN